ncbi:ATP12 family protein [Pseudosulfitobacter sp. DSM 107133]|jgi:chaperone required for assembly of F1-ATPase|uniref:ATP12 family chaperone protein n=1 Tax=Pseudosulfitobacter sp. DSM 107133 TaxID=2883100 RepID=UPI000DF45BF6|nr:ATP12 family protein [Pseudosulfitobacter sp. DSM 107133]UOA28281.1 hypothetical protein DSM107133_03027 [Pseudosulfitobacter sp. DSM 107133]
MSEWKQKKFWTRSEVTEAEGGFGVALDGRGVKTPAKAPLVVPSRRMAQAIADEWAAQEGTVDPTTMPFTRSANAAIDKVHVQHAEVADLVAAYGDADLLCYRAASPEGLVARQAERWDPLLDWAHVALNVKLATLQGVMHVPQDPSALAALAQRTHALDAFELTGFHDLVSLSGSLIIGFAALHDAREASELWHLSRLDEEWQAEFWGNDDEADAEAAIKKASFLHAKSFVDAHRAG